MGKCYLCKSSERDEVKYGEFMTRGGISVHYFCLLLTSNLLQRGKDHEGFLGFLLVDIKKEAVRVAPAACYYCKKKGANIACCATKCRRSFHLICGIKNDCENQFVGTFKSFCDRHVSGKKLRGPQENEICCICYDDLRDGQGKYNSVTMLQAPCCKNGWFHKWCLASFAKSAGYFFKCPLCNDSEKFRQRLVYRGIFIPDRDASWELEPNAFSELLERPGICSASTCNARGGRTSINPRNKLIFCLGCGSVAIHRCCIENKAEHFYCNDCQETFAEVNDTTVVNMSHHTDSDEEEDVDICGEDDDAPILNNIETDSPEEIVRRHRRGRLAISDDERSDVNITDAEDDIIRVCKLRRRNNRLISYGDSVSESSDDVENIRVQRRCRRNLRIESSDSCNSIETVVCKTKLRTSRNSESFFDSGAGSDRSDSSTEKSHLIDNSKIEINESTDVPSEKPRIERRFTSLNNGPKDDWCVAKRTRRQSVNPDMKICSEKPDISETCSSEHFIRSSSPSMISLINTSIVYEELSNAAETTKNGIELVSPTEAITTQTTEPHKIKNKIPTQSRIQSEECPKIPSSTSVTQRRSSLQVASNTNQSSSCSNLQPHKLFDVHPNKTKLRTSRKSESNFNSGAGSDRSDSSTEKLHYSKIEIKESTEKLSEKPRIARRFTSLNNGPKDDWCVAKRTRRQSVNADMKICSEKPDISETCSAHFIQSSSLSMISPINTSLVSAELSNVAEKTKNGMELVSPTQAQTTEPLKIETTKNKIPTRLRTQSEECPKSSSTSVTRRRSSLQVTSNTNQSPSCSSLQAHKLFDVLPNKRSRSDSQSSIDFIFNKKQKTNNTANANENDYINSVSKSKSRRSFRSRSPLGLNHSSINAFITPSYIRERQAQSDGQKQVADYLTKEPLQPRIERKFTKNRSNISNRNRNKQDLVTCINGDSHISEMNNVQNNRVLEIFKNSYNILLSPGKKKRSRKIVFQGFTDKNVPNNQTRIETFFKRI